jgi:hypothetical protein
MQRGFCWMTINRPVDEYLELWTNEIQDAGNVPREEWDEYWTWLEAKRRRPARVRPALRQHPATDRLAPTGTEARAPVAARRSRGL